jgi:hypothetical protein
MPKHVIERQFLLPVYQRLVVEADTPEEARGEAIEREDWDDAVDDYVSARATTITAIKRIPEGIDPAELDFDPDNPRPRIQRRSPDFSSEVMRRRSKPTYPNRTPRRAECPSSPAGRVPVGLEGGQSG